MNRKHVKFLVNVYPSGSMQWEANIIALDAMDGHSELFSEVSVYLIFVCNGCYICITCIFDPLVTVQIVVVMG